MPNSSPLQRDVLKTSGAVVAGLVDTSKTSFIDYHWIGDSSESVAVHRARERACRPRWLDGKTAVRYKNDCLTWMFAGWRGGE